MSENTTTISVDTKTLVGKGGPITGSALSVIGTIITLIGFALPWASCGTYSLSGFDIVSESISGDLEGTGGAFLAIVPSLALIVLGISIANFPIALLKKVPNLLKLIATGIILFGSAIACCPSILFFTNMQAARNDPDNMGLGALIKVEFGFWLSLLGILLSMLGGLIAVATSVANLAMSKKKESPEESEEE